MGFFDIFRISQIKNENEVLRAANAQLLGVQQENQNLRASLLSVQQENEALHASNEEI